MTKNVKHSKGTVRWGTPNGKPEDGEDIVDRCRRVMGAIDFDPCSEERFNAVVKATRYYSLLERGEDALLLPWEGRTMCNHPGGLTKKFWRKLFQSPDVTQCMWIGFSNEQLGILASEEYHPSDFSICYHRKRVPFNRHDAQPDDDNNPAHANYTCGVGVDHNAFVREFGPLGKIQAGPLAIYGIV